MSRVSVWVLLVCACILAWWLAIGFVLDAHGAKRTHTTLIGASGGYEVERLADRIDRPLPAHVYADLTDEPVTDARYINVEAESIGEWRAVAHGFRDRYIRAWAEALAGTGDKLVSFNHEPSVDFPIAGTAQDYRRAYRHVAGIFHALAPNVRMVWAVTQASLTGSAKLFWPGESVDLVSSNAFNRYRCTRKAEPWQSFADEVDPLIELGRYYHRPVVVSEFGMGPLSRPGWLHAAARYVMRHPRIEALFYYQSPWNQTCDWLLRSDADLAAFTQTVDSLREPR